MKEKSREEQERKHLLSGSPAVKRSIWSKKRCFTWLFSFYSQCLVKSKRLLSWINAIRTWAWMWAGHSVHSLQLAVCSSLSCVPPVSCAVCTVGFKEPRSLSSVPPHSAQTKLNDKDKAMIVCDVRAMQRSCLHEALLWQPLASGQEASVDGGDNDSPFATKTFARHNRVLIMKPTCSPLDLLSFCRHPTIRWHDGETGKKKKDGNHGTKDS